MSEPPLNQMTFPVRVLVILIGAHSLALGALMLLASPLVLPLMGFSGSIPTFFPSQSGIFLVILGVLYLAALRYRDFVLAIFVSKAIAVVFLVVHAAFLGAPPIIWLAALGDGAMFAALLVAVLRDPAFRTDRPSPSDPAPLRRVSR